MPWTENAMERLNRVPKFERQMVREMVESLDRDNGHSAVKYDLADEMLIKVRQMWEAQSEGAFGFFKGMAANDNQPTGNGGSPDHE
jgi:hypothetical protein